MEKETILQSIHEKCDGLMPALKEKKKELKLTSQDISDRTGVSNDTVRKFFAGKSKSPNVYNMMSICIALGVSLDELLGNPCAVKAEQPDDERIRSMEHEIRELNIRLSYEKKVTESLENMNTVRKKIINSLLAICTLMTVFNCMFLIIDKQAPNYGLIQEGNRNPAVILVILCVFFSAAAVVSIIVTKKNRSENKTEAPKDE